MNIEREYEEKASQLIQVLHDPMTLQLFSLLSAFNPFKVLRVGGYEIRHANTLAWLLNPTENHGLGEAFLRAFLSKLNGKDAPGTIAEKFELALDRLVTVRRELPLTELNRRNPSVAERLGVGDSEHGDTGKEEPMNGEDEGIRTKAGALDILVEGDGWMLVIEAKVRSGEGKGQLSKYRTAIEKSRQDDLDSGALCLVYLTVGGDEPSEESEKDHWVAANWRDHVICTLNDVLLTSRKTQSVTGPVTYFLESYLETLRDVTTEGQHEELVSKIIRKHRLALISIKEVLNKMGKRNVRSEGGLAHIARLNSNVLDVIFENLESTVSVRATSIRKVLQQEGFDIPAGPDSYISFVPRHWNKKFLGIFSAKDKPPRVVFMVVNKQDRLSILLQIGDLGESFSGSEAERRRRLMAKIYDSKRIDLFPLAFYKTREGMGVRPKSPSDQYFSVFNQALNVEPQSGPEEVALAVKATIDDTTFKSRLDFLNGLMEMVSTEAQDS